MELVTERQVLLINYQGRPFAESRINTMGRMFEVLITTDRYKQAVVENPAEPQSSLALSM